MVDDLLSYCKVSMSQIQEVICLTHDQITTVLNNLFSILELTDMKTIFTGKPVFSRENEEKYKLQHITKFADNYTVYEGIRTSQASDAGTHMYFIVIEATKFDKLNISACSWFYHLFENNINTKSKRPQVYICPAFVVTDSMMLHLPVNIIPCLYRFLSLTEAYPMIGSKNNMFGMTYDYKVIPNTPCYNNRSYPVIYDSDVIVKILNAMTGDLIVCKRVMYDGSPYGEYCIREVHPTKSDIHAIGMNGISYPDE